MRIYSIFRVGVTAGAMPVLNCQSLDSARRYIKSANGEFFIVVRYVRLGYGYSPETIEEQLSITKSCGRNYYHSVKPFKISE